MKFSSTLKHLYKCAEVLESPFFRIKEPVPTLFQRISQAPDQQNGKQTMLISTLTIQV